MRRKSLLLVLLALFVGGYLLSCQVLRQTPRLDELTYIKIDDWGDDIEIPRTGETEMAPVIAVMDPEEILRLENPKMPDAQTMEQPPMAPEEQVPEDPGMETEIQVPTDVPEAPDLETSVEGELENPQPETDSPAENGDVTLENPEASHQYEILEPSEVPTIEFTDPVLDHIQDFPQSLEESSERPELAISHFELVSDAIMGIIVVGFCGYLTEQHFRR